MPARVVVVLREQALANKTAEALINAGYDAVAMRNSMAALKALEAARRASDYKCLFSRPSAKWPCACANNETPSP